MEVDDVNASFITLDVSHDFVLGTYSTFANTSFFRDLTITPSACIAIDHRYYDKAGVGNTHSTSTRLGYIEYGLAFSLDLNSAMNIPTKYGFLTLGTFINYVQSFHDDSILVQDQLYGGLKVGWAW